MVKGIPLRIMFNSHYFTAELLYTIVGSFGFATVAPFNALVGAWIFTRGSAATSSEESETKERIFP